jgi:mono/diheme cytochrome c family protein
LFFFEQKLLGVEMKKKIILGIVVLAVVIQFIPYGKNHENPAVQSQVKWDSAKTEQLFASACKDCHSNETKWPWYSNIAPVSWLVYNDVQEGREHFNISMIGKQRKNKLEDAAESVEEGDMPFLPYLITHPEARLSTQETEELIKGLKATFGEE